MRVRVKSPEGKLVQTFANEIEYDNEFRNNHNIISEKFVGYGEPIENEYHGIVYENSVLEVTVS